LHLILTAFRPIQESTQETQELRIMEANSTDGRDPSGFLTEIIGAPVTVKLNSGIVYKGSLSRKAILYTI
jgi:hypothetical protein